ncbi:sugar ABC transporter ATP-binding protein [Cohaesibacter celericrescens]|uniref:Sugar ABC transporter ATP-binding protein n=1 Tax=Cohaesibacter celericrescens TaxID=2067669 RepID=A0A2N5XJZ5_9HYPH|nr:sugar ABC transporter ATP-binding protein [Cohaesibacter celericrescens]PLW74841.1 sugar ABC transporter ATP-binding protein [Cohaesibacter celericrescens]
MSQLPSLSTHLLELRGIHKRFGGVHALRGVDMVIDPGEAYHLLGENGCGKSTVIKIISGVHAPSEGEIILDGKSYGQLSPIQALEAGVETVYQDLSLLPNLTVEENVALGQQLVSGKGSLLRPLDKKLLKETAREAILNVGLVPDKALMSSPTADLPLAVRQRVAIARAIACKARLVIMDEPTTSLTRKEVDALIELVAKLRAQDVAVLFVTHKLEESYRIGGQVIVFRDGQCVAQGNIADYSRADLSHLMTGREIESQRYRTGTPQTKEMLRLSNAGSGDAFYDISFSLKMGEILGITGLSDSGRNELALAMTGHLELTHGQIEIEDQATQIASPASAIKQGIGYVPEDRLSEGLFIDKSIYENEVTLIFDDLLNRFGMIDAKKGREAARNISEHMTLNTSDIDLPVGALSGGNQQRVLIGRWLSIEPKILVLHGPTVGVDVGSKDSIYRAVQAMAERGISLIIVSDDLPELLQNCDRILVMNRGRVVDELDAATTNEERIYNSMLASYQEVAE